MCYDIHHMTIDKEDQIIKWIIANRNTTMAATAASPHLEERKVMEHEVSNEDFVWPSR
jgi:hypothetical protein